MEAITLRAVVRELRKECLPARVQGISQPSASAVVLSLGGREGRSLVLSALPAAAGIHADTRRLPSIPPAGPLCLVMRRKLTGLVLGAIEQPGLERAVHLYFSRSAAEPPAFRVIGEFMGAGSNIILVEEPSTVIVESMRQSRRREGAARAVLAGEPYVPPPEGGRKDLSSLGREEFLELCGASRREGRPLHQLVIGLGPGLAAIAEERRNREGGGGDGGLFDAIAAVAEDIERGRLEPAFYPRRLTVLPFPVRGWTEEVHPFPSVSAAAARCWSEALEREERARLEVRLRRDLARKRKKLAKKEVLLRAESEQDGTGDLLQAAGQALLAAMHEVPRGAAAFTFRRPWDREGTPETVALDPSAGPRRNAEILFKKAKKAKRRARSARLRLPALLDEIAEAQAGLDAIPDLPLEELRVAAGKGQARGRGRTAGAAPGKVPPVREYRGDGWRVLVGKSSRGNDYLTSRIAGPEDFWFHVRDNPGAHVVLKSLQGAGDPPPEVLEAAAGIAAWHSALRGESRVDVACARRKHVRKVRGQPPGKVLLSKSTTVRVAPGIPEGYRLVEGGLPPSVVK